jgi:N-acyl-D-amino-acid deacylase
MTYLPASYYRLPDRGLIREGYWADITVFDPETVIDRSTWREPSLYSEGIIHVLMDGKLALENGAMTGGLHGQFVSAAGR